MMYISRVRAVAFGAIPDRTLELDDGLTVVFGDNGSGKSTWHAALYAALCGHPPADQMTEDDHEFECERRPRDGGTAWQVQAELCSDQHQRTEVTQDLAARSANGSTRELREAWQRLRLDRYSFAATAWIEQENAEPTPGAIRRRSILNAATRFVREDEALAALRRIEGWRQEIGIPGSGGRLDQLRARYGDLHRQADVLLDLQDRRSAAERALRDAEAALTTAERRLRLTHAAAARAEVRRIQALIDALSGATPPPGGFEPFVFGAPPFGPTPEQRHDSVVAAQAALTAADADLASLTPPVPSWPPPPASPPPVALPSRRWRVVPAVSAGVLLATGMILGAVGQLVVAAIVGALAAVLAVVAALPTSGRQTTVAPPVAPPAAPPPPSPEALAPEADPWKSDPPPAPTAEGEDARRAVTEALRSLADALTDAGYPTRPEEARATGERYRAERADADLAAEHQRQQRTTEREQLEEDLAQAQERADQMGAGLSPYDIASAWPTGYDSDEVDRVGRTWLTEREKDCERARDELARCQATAGGLAAQEATILAGGDPVARCAQALARLERWEEVNTVLDLAGRALTRAQRDTRRDVVDAIGGNLFDYLPVITGRPRVSATLDPDTFELRITEPAGSALMPGTGSNSTRQLGRLFARVALGSFVIRQGGEPGPLLVDEPSGRANGRRMDRVLDKLLDIASRRQVVVFTADHAVLTWAKHHRPAVHLLWLGGVDAWPERYNGQDERDHRAEE